MDNEQVKTMLDAEEQRLTAARDALHREQLEVQTGGPVDPRSGESTLSRELEESLLTTVESELSDLAAARRRLADGTYGICERCGAAISDDRLRAVPATRYCTGDEAKAEILVESRYLDGTESPAHAVDVARREASRHLDLVGDAEDAEVGDADEPDDTETGPEDRAMHVRQP